MTIPPKYTITTRIQNLLRNLDILKVAFTLVPINPLITRNIRRASLLKSSIYSARIEGNPLEPYNISEHSLIHPTTLSKREITNIARALNFIDRESPKRLSLEYLKKLHAIVLEKISSDTGQFRTEVSAIFNEGGVAIYMTPPPQKIEELINKWYSWCNTSGEPGPVKAALAHFWFEKIHPFLDGNGRVGRLVITYILKQSGYDFGGLITFEEYLDEHRQTYYDELNSSGQDITSFVEFFLESIASQAQLLIEQIKNPLPQMQSNLLPRRQEILDTIRDHTMVSFDMLWRRFQRVPKSTLHNDLKQLMKAGLIKKLGTTRGVVYTQS